MAYYQASFEPGDRVSILQVRAQPRLGRTLRCLLDDCRQVGDSILDAPLRLRPQTGARRDPAGPDHKSAGVPPARRAPPAARRRRNGKEPAS